MLPALFALGLLLAPPVHTAPEGVTAEAVLTEFKEGNLRFVEGHRVRTLRSDGDPGLRGTLAGSQHPLAVVITCSDSRLADNLIFDQELGRIFTVREAGNSPDTLGLASVEYAVEHLGCPVVIVMGHTSCGAVKAVTDAQGKPLPGNFRAFQTAMAGLLESTPPAAGEDPKAYQARLASVNATRQAKAILQHSDVLREKVAEGHVKIVPALYDLASGKVTFLGQGPAPALTQGSH